MARDASLQELLNGEFVTANHIESPKKQEIAGLWSISKVIGVSNVPGTIKTTNASEVSRCLASRILMFWYFIWFSVRVPI